ncbi:hypothetical protein GCM10020000_16270 [Streptomyces olivoverticillatus]
MGGWTVSDQKELLADPTMLTLARDSRGWTQSELAERMSHVEGSRITQGYVSRAEAGRIPVRADRVLLFAAALHFTPEMLCQAADTAGVGIGLIHHRKRASLGAPRAAPNPCDAGAHPPPGRSGDPGGSPPSPSPVQAH